MVALNSPAQGHYMTRLTKGGPFAPVRIWRPCHCTVNGSLENLEHEWRDTCDRHGPLVALLNGAEVSMDRVWPYCARWPIPAKEYRRMLAVREWAMTVPGTPESEPNEKVDPLRAAPLF